MAIYRMNKDQKIKSNPARIVTAVVTTAAEFELITILKVCEKCDQNRDTNK